MNASTLSELALGFLTVTPEKEGAALSLRMIGTADTRAMDSLDALLRAAHEEARRTAAPEVVVDMRDLEFMNSSCFKTFVSWIESVVELPGADRYRIRFVSDPGRTWQQRSLTALSCFAVDLIQVTT